MHIIGRGAATHTQRLEKWLGADAVARVSDNMKDFYYPIAMHGVPGNVYAMPGGDFAGEIKAGSEASAIDRALDLMVRQRRAIHGQMANRVNAPRFRKQHGAFASLSALIAAATGGKSQDFNFTKTGVAGTAIGGVIDLWTLGAWPTAGAAGSALPGGKVWSNADTGGLKFVNPSTANSAHFTTGWATASVINNTLMMYDRLFSAAITMNSTAVQACNGVPTRYQSVSANSPSFCGGSFAFPSIPTTLLPATAHNWTVCTYQNASAGNVAFPSIAGISACAKNQVDLALGSWFMPLAGADNGILEINQIQCSALLATGTVDFVLGHPIALMPCPIANLVCVQDGINTAFNLAYVLDGACLAFLEMPKPAASAVTYSGLVKLVSE